MLQLYGYMYSEGRILRSGISRIYLGSHKEKTDTSFCYSVCCIPQKLEIHDRSRYIFEEWAFFFGQLESRVQASYSQTSPPTNRWVEQRMSMLSATGPRVGISTSNSLVESPQSLVLRQSPARETPIMARVICPLVASQHVSCWTVPCSDRAPIHSLYHAPDSG